MEVLHQATFGFWLSLFLTVSYCHSKDETVEVVGFIGSTDFTESKMQNSQTFSGFYITFGCKSPDGKLKTMGSSELDDEEKFRVFLSQEIIKDGLIKEECYAQLHNNAADSPCPLHNSQEDLKITFQYKAEEKQTITQKLNFSPITCTSKFLWPFFNHPYLPKLPPYYSRTPTEFSPTPDILLPPPASPSQPPFSTPDVPLPPSKSLSQPPFATPDIPLPPSFSPFKQPLPPSPVYKKSFPPTFSPPYLTPKGLPPLLSPAFKNLHPPIPVANNKPFPPPNKKQFAPTISPPISPSLLPPHVPSFTLPHAPPVPVFNNYKPIPTP